jgi:hypothetical protein
MRRLCPPASFFEGQRLGRSFYREFLPNDGLGTGRLDSAALAYADPPNRRYWMRHLGILVVLALAALAWTAAAQGSHVTLPDPTVEACEAAVDSQIESEIQAGGGPKAVDVAPINCDTFWFRGDTIGNELSGGPVACFWSLLRELPEHCPPGS